MQKADGPILIEDLDAVTAGAQVADTGHPANVALHKPVRTRSMLEGGIQKDGYEAGHAGERNDW